MAVNEAILPEPLAANPIDGVLLVQLNVNVPPVVGLLKFTAAVGVPLHRVWLATAFTTGVGLTVIVNVTGAPTQVIPPLLKLIVTVIVATTGALVAFVALKESMSPVPAAGNPIDGVLLVQLNVMIPPPDGEVKLIFVVGLLLHTTWLATGLTIG